ncbi:MAG: 3'(2'),5'-bisphosphate nucleotidase [Planctomycetota bacterium]|nr:3'(2'),5'-bisphosphate nucleotidase [Planctomycetaceae bacterium]MDQ3330119.1 3'(2'),5'-bisphosphate nucleotidase [Planctomycetota bacterium]
MTKDFTNEARVAIEAVRQAAVVCRAVQSSISRDAIEKKDKSPVTVADFASQAVVCRALHAAFPNDAIIGEEDAAELRTAAMSPFRERIVGELTGIGVTATGDEICDWIDCGRANDFRQRFWTLDPIDGTKGFLRGEQYAISLALIVDGRIEIGILGCPNLPVERESRAEGTSLPTSGSLFVAVRGQGSQVFPLNVSVAAGRRIAVSQTTDPRDARLCESVESGHSAHDDSARIAAALGISQEPVRLDSQAKYAVVADGRADVYLRLPTRKDYVEKIWDHAGGVLVVEEAGGIVTDVDGKPLDFTHGRGLDRNRGVVVTNGPWHESVLKAIADVLA